MSNLVSDLLIAMVVAFIAAFLCLHAWALLDQRETTELIFSKTKTVMNLK